MHDPTPIPRNLLFGFEEKKKSLNGGTFIIVVCFHEDTPLYV